MQISSEDSNCRFVVCLLLLVFLGAGLTGCASFDGAQPATSATTIHSVRGNVFGGQQPITGASIQLYAAGTASGYGTGATPVLTKPVSTDSNGGFNITGLYTCNVGAQMYIVSSGGDPGMGSVNAAATLVAALGPCEDLNATTFITINEVTTVGTVWALAGFMKGANIGAPASNAVGLEQAFADVNTLVNVASGAAPGPAAPAGAVVPSDKIAAIANSLAACINSSASGVACSHLFAYTTPAGGSVPTDTLGAAINMASGEYPVANTASILQLAVPSPPFPTSLVSATDMTLAVTYGGGGISAPTALAIDSGGNVWVANGNNSVSELSHSGQTVTGSGGYSAGGVNSPTAIAVDTSGHVWTANGNSTVSELTSAGTAVLGSPYSGGGLQSPKSIAFDGFGNVWLANANNSVSEFSSTGVPLSLSGGFLPTGLTTPIGLAVNPR